MSIVLIWFSAFAIDLLFAGQISWHETATAIVLASLTTAWALIVRKTSQRYFGFAPEALRPLGRGLGKLVRATAATVVVLARVAVLGRRTGHAQVHDFEYGAREDADVRGVDRARRAIAVLLASCAPDRFVVNVDRDSGKVLMHVIVPSERELDARWLI